MALVRGTAVGEKGTQGAGLTPVEAGLGMHAGQDLRGPWELILRHTTGLNVMVQLLGIMVVRTPGAQTLGSELVFAPPVTFLPYQGLVFPNGNHSPPPTQAPGVCRPMT